MENLVNITENGEIVFNGIDEWGRIRIGILLEDGTMATLSPPPPTGFQARYTPDGNAIIWDIPPDIAKVQLQYYDEPNWVLIYEGLYNAFQDEPPVPNREYRIRCVDAHDRVSRWVMTQALEARIGTGAWAG